MRYIKRCFPLFAVLLTTWLMLDILLLIADPLGVWDYLHSKYVLATVTTVTDIGYTYTDGVYIMPRWVATIENGNRMTPDTNIQATCTVAAVGDSVTFASGIQDNETWVNRLALALPGVAFVNAGKPAYNITNVHRTIESMEADAFIYLIISNDDLQTAIFKPENNLGLRYRDPLLAYLTYFTWMKIASPPYTIDAENFDSELSALANRDDVYLFALAENDLHTRHEAITVLPVNRSAYRLSVADGHLNADGNQAIADAMLPYLDDVCVTTL